MTSKSPNLSALSVKLSLVPSASIRVPPSLIVTVKNAHPSAPFTLLTWSSPLDSLALKLGLFQITPDSAIEPLDLPVVMIKRRMPPSPDSLLTLNPGEESSKTVILEDPPVPGQLWQATGQTELKTKIKVKLVGRWMAVWPSRGKTEIDEHMLEELGVGEGALTGDFESNELDIVLG